MKPFDKLPKRAIPQQQVLRRSKIVIIKLIMLHGFTLPFVSIEMDTFAEVRTKVLYQNNSFHLCQASLHVALETSCLIPQRV